MATYSLIGERYLTYPWADKRYYTYRAWGSLDTTDYPDRVDYTFTGRLTVAKTTSAPLGGRYTGTYTGNVTGTGTDQHDVSINVTPASSEGDQYIPVTFSGSIPKLHYAYNASAVLQFANVVFHSAGSGSITRNCPTSYASVVFEIPTKVNYLISYVPNGGSSTPVAQTKWYGEALTLAAAISRTGYSFNGWKASNGTVYSASGSYTANEATTLTAQWLANTYTVVYNGNGNTGGSTASSSHTYDVAKNLTSNGFTKTDYLFKGWATTQAKADAGTVDYTDGQSVANLTATNGATVNLYAVWEYAYTDPNILTLSVERVNGSHALDDTGTNAKVTVIANPAGEKTVAGGAASPISTRIQIYYKRSISDASETNMLPLLTYDTITTPGSTSTQYIDAASTGKTGFAIGTDEQCEILVVAQGIDDNAVKCTAQRTTLLQTAKFIFDLNQDPQYDSVALFGVAPDINDVMYINGDILLEVDFSDANDKLAQAIHDLGWDSGSDSVIV